MGTRRRIRCHPVVTFAVLVVSFAFLCEAVEQQGQAPQEANDGQHPFDVESRSEKPSTEDLNLAGTVESQGSGETAVGVASAQQNSSVEGSNGPTQQDESIPGSTLSPEIPESATNVADDMLGASESDAAGTSLKDEEAHASTNPTTNPSTLDSDEVVSESQSQTLYTEDIQNEPEIPDKRGGMASKESTDQEETAAHEGVVKEESNGDTHSDNDNDQTNIPSSDADYLQSKDQTSSDHESSPAGSTQSNKEAVSADNIPDKPTPNQGLDPDYMDLDEPAIIAPKTSIAIEDSEVRASDVQASESETKAGNTDFLEENVQDDGTGAAETQGIARSDDEEANGQPTNHTKPSSTQQEDTILGETPQTEERKKSKEGSLASFMEKVKNQGQDLSGQPLEPNTQQNTPKNPSSPKPIDDLRLHEEEEEEAKSKDYTGTWGVFNNNKRYADLEVLGLLFDKRLADNASNRYNKVFEPLDDLIIPTLYSKTMAGQESNDDSIESTAPMEDLSSQRSVNTEFVEGLDDISKLFQAVDPPDELDVGAAGTSIQDVLMGQTSKIVIKRIKLGAQYVSKTINVFRLRVLALMADEDRKLPSIKKEQLAQGKDWVVARVIEVYGYGKDLFESIFKDEDELEGEEFMSYASDLQKKLQDMTSSKENDPPTPP